jgi:mono/diheme cytochrome c family protein
MRRTLRAVAGIAALLLAGCEDSMRDQARIKPLEPSAFFADGRSARTPPPGTVARGELRSDAAFFTGTTSTGFVPRVPFAVTRELLERGRERFTIYCAVCHGADGYGLGVIVQRGFSPPESYHSPRLRGMPDGYLYDVIPRGKGAMFSYADRVQPTDRWAIVAYIRALQLSQHAQRSDVPAEQHGVLQEKQP